MLNLGTADTPKNPIAVCTQYIWSHKYLGFFTYYCLLIIQTLVQKYTINA